MPIEIKMPLLSPTMEEGTLARWLVGPGEVVRSGDILAEIETDKATMEFEAADEGVILSLTVAEGADGVKVGTVIAILSDGDAPLVARVIPGDLNELAVEGLEPVSAEVRVPAEPMAGHAVEVVQIPANFSNGDNCAVTPLAHRLAHARGIDVAALRGTGAYGQVTKADVDAATPKAQMLPSATDGIQRFPIAQSKDVASVVAASPGSLPIVSAGLIPDVPHTTIKLSNMRRTIARRLTESKQQVPHIYLTVDVRLDALLALRAELNEALSRRGIKLSINDLIVKALAVALRIEPKCNVMFTSDQLVTFERADISVAVSTPTGLITPVIVAADTKSIGTIATEIKDLAVLARDGKLKPEQYQGGTASISNLGMYAIKQFNAVINPPQGTILAVGAGRRSPWVSSDDTLEIATVMSATGSFDHRAIDGSDAAALMRTFEALIEDPLSMLS